MNMKLNCPVCGYKEIEGKTCPNCDTDLSLIRTLQELAPVEKTSIQKKISNWSLLVALLMLIIGIGLGAVGSFILIKGQYNAAIYAPNSTIVNSTETNTQEANIYIVQPGDNLGLIAEKICGKASAWRSIAQANPRLANRRNYFIDVGEKLKVPKCQEKNL
ncbi:LysM peptidoglycan-binding domain-containing protein [Anabaena sphaerica FACHB-251]|uniref:LysM peptidoglycan-binding domain-containing protein n=1 Tax=Anabaena sphaerica FACHB-251 TaxID=2692883 RepID=A0A926WHC5_9NOST|nr:LysM peptidoglycan-binding domain-containing protein [Anabaena sphaerica]MBD2293501.1 LysM peptidoglycan-binding domain-containing protein [Anabaena sphaerica FACHB-251]